MVQSPLPTVSGDYFNDVEGRVPIGGGGSPKPPPGGSSGKSILCQDQFISRLFLVAKKDGSFWLVINLKPLNSFVQNSYFKMEGSGMIKDPLQAEHWMCTLDKLFLPEEKVQNITQTCLTQGRVSEQQLSQLLGKFNSSSQAILSAPVRYHQLQQVKILSLRRSRSFNALVMLNQRATEKLLWGGTNWKTG